MYQCPIRCSVLCEDRAAKRLFASSFAIDGPDLVKVSFVATKAKVIPSGYPPLKSCSIALSPTFQAGPLYCIRITNGLTCKIDCYQNATMLII